MSFDKESVHNGDEDRARTEGQEIEPRFETLGSTYRRLRSCLMPPLTYLVTLSIPAFYASLIMGDTVVGLKAVVSTWKELRSFDGILLAALVATSFKSSAQINAIGWFFISCSMIQAIMGLICSTILIIFFSGYRKNYHHIDAARLHFILWNVWDLLSIPAIWTTWSIITFATSLIIDAACPKVVQDDYPGTKQDSHFLVAKVMLSLLMCIASANFVFFMLHLRRISQAFAQVV